jgi:hypothetical protein
MVMNAFLRRLFSSTKAATASTAAAAKPGSGSGSGSGSSSPSPAAPPVKIKTAIVLMNLGGPSTLNDVYPFLLRLFSDKDLIPIPFQKYLAPWIAKRRTPKIQDQYAKIGGGSPITHWTSRQGQLLETLMDKIRPQSGKNNKNSCSSTFLQ